MGAAHHGKAGLVKLRATEPEKLPAGEDSAVVVVEIGALLDADSPRLSGESLEHVQMLAETEGKLPPILVDRRTMRVVDGMHRVRAAALRGAGHIEVKFFDGTPEAAFLAAVKQNSSHGLPLSRADRQAAAARIVSSFPELSDRAIGSACAVSAKTVATIRRRSSGDAHELRARAGLDGRVRPLDVTEGRRAAQKIIQARPDASLREIASESGISPNTARDVREKMRRGEDPVSSRQRRSGNRTSDPANLSDSFFGHGFEPGISSALVNMKRDPSLRFTEAGRRLLHWLDVHAANCNGWQEMIKVIPPYRVNSVADLARQCARTWENFADGLDRHDGVDVDRHDGTA